MSTLLQKTHLLPRLQVHSFSTIFVRKQPVQGQKTVEVVPEDFNCNARDEAIQEKEAFGECLARPPVERNPVVAFAVFPDGQNGVFKSVRADKSDKLFDRPDFLREHDEVGDQTCISAS